VTSKRTATLDALIEQATADAYNDEEQRLGLYTAIEDHLAVPFTTQVLGVEVTVAKVDLTGTGVVALCRAGRSIGRLTGSSRPSCGPFRRVPTSPRPASSTRTSGVI
jgi:hypothetical protein